MPPKQSEKRAQPSDKDATEDQAQAQTQGSNAPQTGSHRPTVKDMQTDSVATLAEAWSNSESAATEYDAQLIERVYNDELVKNDYSVAKLALLEVSQYLEKVKQCRQLDHLCMLLTVDQNTT